MVHLIFDFDGTLVDSYAKVIEKFNVLADEFNFRKIHESELTNLKNLSSKELIQYLKIPIHKIPKFMYKARKEMRNELPKLKSFVNLPQVLQEIYKANFSLGILTSNSEENVTAWLKLQNIYHLFAFIHTESNFFGKARVLRKILKKYKMKKDNVFYIGDETRDIEAAKLNGIHSIAVTWGFNSEKILFDHQPDYIARKAEDLSTLFVL